MPFAPGAIYGDDEPVPKWSIGSPQLRRQGIRQLLCREDRLAAPMMALRYTDGKWMAVFHHASGAATTVADRGKVAGGEVLIDRRFDFASLGGVERPRPGQPGRVFPGVGGPCHLQHRQGPPSSTPSLAPALSSAGRGRPAPLQTHICLGDGGHAGRVLFRLVAVGVGQTGPRCPSGGGGTGGYVEHLSFG